MQQLFPSFSYPCRYTQQRLPNGWPHRPLLDVQDGSSLAALLADGPSAGGRRSCMDKLYGTPLLAPPDKRNWKKSKWATKLEALSESDSLSDLYDSLKLVYCNKPTTWPFFSLDKSDGFKLQYQTPTRWLIWKIAYRNQVNKIVFVFFWGSELRSVQRFHPSDFPTKDSAWWKTSRGPFCDSNFQLLPPLVRTTKERRALGTNLGIILKQHGSTECDACYRNLPHHNVHIYWLIPPLQEFQMFSCN